MAAILMLWVAVAVACALVGRALGERKGRGSEGFWLGLFLGVVGIVIVLVISPTPEAQARFNQEVARAAERLGGAAALRPCPWCAELVQPAARLCRYCGRDIEPLRAR